MRYALIVVNPQSKTAVWYAEFNTEEQAQAKSEELNLQASLKTFVFDAGAGVAHVPQ